MKPLPSDPVPPQLAVSLDGLFHERARRSPESLAYRSFNDHSGTWQDYTWSQMVNAIGRWQAALERENLQTGTHVAVMLKNCPEWVMFDQAALGLGLVTVPLYPADRPDNAAYVLQDCGARLLLIDSAEHWRPIHESGELSALARIVTLKPLPAGSHDDRLRSIEEWLPDAAGEFRHVCSDPGQLASIIYTSGTTGQPKGVMLSHRNMLENCWSILKSFEIYRSDHFLSFLPLSHTFERTAGYYLPVMAGASVTYARSFQQLQEDLALARPTILMSVPRIYERMHAALRNKLAKGPGYARKLFDLAVNVGYSRFEYRQGRGEWRFSHLLWPFLKQGVADKLASRLGGRMRIAVSGGAALPPEIARVFIGLGVTVLQGYGLTEASPVISVNRPDDNIPASVGTALSGVEARLGENGELQVRGSMVMMGYWNSPAATRTAISEDGWLSTGDVARIDESGHIFITGRLKEIIVLSNGEKVPPLDMEAAILADPLFEQVMVAGEGRSHLCALAVVNREIWQAALQEHGIPAGWPTSLAAPKAHAFALSRMARQIRAFPGYAKIRRVTLLAEPWTPDNGLLTPTLKLKRAKVLEHYRAEYEKMYAAKP